MPQQVIIFPDVEALLVQHLTTQLPLHGQAVTAHTQIPQTRPDKFVTVSRAGGTRRTLVVDAATMTVESWGLRPAAAYTLAQVVRGILGALPGAILGGYPVYRVDEFAGPANLPDPTSGHARYTQTISVFLRGRPYVAP